MAKVAIVGAGRVGSTLAYTLVTSGLARELVLVDADAERARGEAMDLADATAFFAPVDVRAGDLADTRGAAVTVLAAGAAQRPGETRLDLLRRNAAVLRDVVPQIRGANPDGILLVATNPVDVLTYAALRLSGLPPRRVMGSGTSLDTARFRAELGRHYRVDPRNVHAYVLGEHGDSEVPAWSAARLAGVSLAEFCGLTDMSCTRRDMDAMALHVRDAAYEIIRRKGATHFGVAAALTRIIQAIVRDEGAVLTVSTLVTGAYGIRDVCLSLPVIVDASGARQTLPVTLDASEVDGLRRCADLLKASWASVEAPVAGRAQDRPGE